jgi:hypothetical protein
MASRGATDEEVSKAVADGVRQPAKRDKWHSALTFGYNKPSPVNGKFYGYKTVDVIYAEESERIVVLTVKVYYHNGQGGKGHENHI